MSEICPGRVSLSPGFPTKIFNFIHLATVTEIIEPDPGHGTNSTNDQCEDLCSTALLCLFCFTTFSSAPDSSYFTVPTETTDASENAPL